MRYQDWDVLVFPDQSKIPLQEFKTTCQVIQDPEPHNIQLTAHLLPTVTSFIPGLPAGSGFRISIHSWRNPVSSRYVDNLKKATDTIIFEARLFIDGRICGSKWFDAAGPWPSIIDLSIDLDKTGDFEKLQFPTFHRELLSQSHWNPGDDLGRIKVVISEGFSRESHDYPFERIKNIVSFSFQHAPLGIESLPPEFRPSLIVLLDVLEQSSIAWPNSMMWRQAAVMSPYYAQQISPRRQEEALETHGHSPRHLVHPFKQPIPLVAGFVNQPPLNNVPRQGNADPFIDTRGSAFAGWRQVSSDVSMPDYASSASHHTSVRNISDPMQISDKGDRSFQSMQMAGAYDQLCEALIPSAPVNTPCNAATPVAVPATRLSSAKSEAGPSIKAKTDDKITFLKHLISDNIKSKKESVTDLQVEVDLTTIINENINRIISQAPAPPAVATNTAAGTKRARVVTPASAKVIDDEDEPRSSPAVRKASRASTSGGKENERRVFSGLENV